jgi:hypothetical protein
MLLVLDVRICKYALLFSRKPKASQYNHVILCFLLYLCHFETIFFFLRDAAIKLEDIKKGI